jgi:hypothetical protein
MRRNDETRCEQYSPESFIPIDLYCTAGSQSVDGGAHPSTYSTTEDIQRSSRYEHQVITFGHRPRRSACMYACIRVYVFV